MRRRFQFASSRAIAVVVVVAALAACTKEVTVGSGGAAVVGIIFCEECLALPRDTEVRVMLEDVSRQDAPAVLVSEQVIYAEGRQSPFDFVLPYDPKSIDERKTYAVRAEIRYGGALRLVSTTRHPVLTRGAGVRVDVLVQPAGAPADTLQ
jgi:putative lipoprotein